LVRRELLDERGPLKTLWARRPFAVKLSFYCEANVSLPFLSIIERLPPLLRKVSGASFADGALAKNMPLEISYLADCPAAGRLRFEGVLVRCADLHGFFAYRTFVRAVEVYRVLPALAQARGHISTVKRHNLIP